MNFVSCYFWGVCLLFFFLVNMSDEDFLRDVIIEHELRNEALEETVQFLRSALDRLDRRYRRLVVRHSKCRPRIIYLHR